MKDTAICYFSATGNAYYVASELVKQVSADLYYIPSLSVEALDPYENIIFVIPVYMFAIPNNIKAFIKELRGMKDHKYYIVLEFGGFSANAADYVNRLFINEGLKLENVFKVTMPITYTLFMREPQIFINMSLKRSKKKIKKVAEKINRRECRKIRKNIFFFFDNLHNKIEGLWGDFPKTYTISDTCTHCGYCAKICPVNNIEVTSDKVEFKGKCISCLACYHRCPSKSINWKNKTNGKKRYVNPYVNLDDMK